MKVLIDTNVFQYLYTSNQEKVAVFDDIQKIASSVFLPDQIIDEFYRNRDLRLSEIASRISNTKLSITASSFVREFSDFDKLMKKCRECEVIKKRIVKKINEIKENPDLDPILEKFEELMENPKIIRADISDEIITKAKNRYLQGNPPKSDGSHTICDEIIWELILATLDDDLIIVTSDLTYKNHNTFLKREFLKETGKTLFVTDKLGDAIKQFGQQPSEATEKFDEENQIRIENYKKAVEVATPGILTAAFDHAGLSESAALAFGLSRTQSDYPAMFPTSSLSIAEMLGDHFTAASAIDNAFAGIDFGHSALGTALEGIDFGQSALVNAIAGIDFGHPAILSVAAQALQDNNGNPFVLPTESDRIEKLSADNPPQVGSSGNSKCPICGVDINREEICKKCGYQRQKGPGIEKL